MKFNDLSLKPDEVKIIDELCQILGIKDYSEAEIDLNASLYHNISRYLTINIINYIFKTAVEKLLVSNILKEAIMEKVKLNCSDSDFPFIKEFELTELISLAKRIKVLEESTQEIKNEI